MSKDIRGLSDIQIRHEFNALKLHAYYLLISDILVTKQHSVLQQIKKSFAINKKC